MPVVEMATASPSLPVPARVVVGAAGGARAGQRRALRPGLGVDLLPVGGSLFVVASAVLEARPDLPGGGRSGLAGSLPALEALQDFVRRGDLVGEVLGGVLPPPGVLLLRVDAGGGRAGGVSVVVRPVGEHPEEAAHHGPEGVLVAGQHAEVDGEAEEGTVGEGEGGGGVVVQVPPDLLGEPSSQRPSPVVQPPGAVSWPSSRVAVRAEVPHVLRLGHGLAALALGPPGLDPEAVLVGRGPVDVDHLGETRGAVTAVGPEDLSHVGGGRDPGRRCPGVRLQVPADDRDVGVDQEVPELVGDAAKAVLQLGRGRGALRRGAARDLPTHCGRVAVDVDHERRPHEGGKNGVVERRPLVEALRVEADGLGLVDLFQEGLPDGAPVLGSLDWVEGLLLLRHQLVLEPHGLGDGHLLVLAEEVVQEPGLSLGDAGLDGREVGVPEASWVRVAEHSAAGIKVDYANQS